MAVTLNSLMIRSSTLPDLKTASRPSRAPAHPTFPSHVACSVDRVSLAGAPAILILCFRLHIPAECAECRDCSIATGADSKIARQEHGEST